MENPGGRQDGRSGQRWIPCQPTREFPRPSERQVERDQQRPSVGEPTGHQAGIIFSPFSRRQTNDATVFGENGDSSRHIADNRRIGADDVRIHDDRPQ